MPRSMSSHILAAILLLSIPTFSGCAAGAIDDPSAEVEAELDEPDLSLASRTEALQVNCDTAALAASKRECERTCADRVQKAHGSEYRGVCLAQPTCTYECFAMLKIKPILE